jgi:hypothetical protein
MLARCLLACAILLAALPAPASAAKKRFRGETAQSRIVRVVVGELGRVQRMVISWRANDCRRRGTFVRNVTVLRPRRRRASADAFTVAAAQFTSDPGDFVGQGRTYSFGPPANDILVEATRSLVKLSTGTWYGEFEAPPGQQLEPGRTYDGARRYPFNDAAPGLSITGEHRGCNELSGTFTVNRIEFDAAGTLRAFEVTFVRHCEHMPPALHGTWTFAAA